MATRLPSLRDEAILFAHRGARAHARENTLEAFSLAVRLGATGIETDAWVTADGHVVLDHDGHHRRFPKVWIREVERVDLRTHVPTLADFYREADSGLPLSVDVKDEAVFGPLLEVARHHGAASRLWLCHHDLEVLCRWRDLAPEVHLVNSTSLERLPHGPERRAAELAAARVEAVNLRQSEWTGGLVTLFHRFEVLAFGWDAQFERQLAGLIDMGIDAVYSDHVDRMVAVARTFTV